jgi:hypothetical protein
VYDPAAAEAYFRKHPLLLARRVATVGGYMLRFAVALLTARVDAAVMGVRHEPGVSPTRRSLAQTIAACLCMQALQLWGS